MSRTAVAVTLVATALVAAACQSEDPVYEDAGVGGEDAADAATVDDVPPDTSITAAPADPSNQATVSISFEAPGEDPLDIRFECSLDGAAFAACTSPHTLTVTDGTHTFEVVAIDAADNRDDTPATATWTTDTVAPDTTITAAPPALDNSTTVSFAFDATETASYECSLDGATFAACTSPHELTGLTDGEHTFQVRATDAAGNVDDTPATHTWTIDSSTPDTQIDDGPTGLVASTDATFTFSSPDAGAGATFECSLDAAAFAACTSPHALTGLGQGDHTFEVRVRDQVGNTDPTPATRTWTVDTVAPDTTITSAPPATTHQTSASFSFTSADSSAAFECSLDGGPFVPCTSPATYTVSAGDHTFAVRARDAAGNADPSPAQHAWSVDTSTPDTTITSAPASPTNATSATFTFTSTEAGSTFQCSLDGGAFAACTSPATFNVTAGSRTFAVRAIDAVGNVDPSPATHAWTVDTTAPDTTITSAPTDPTNATSATFTFTSTEAGSTFQCSLNGGAFAACTSPATFTVAAGARTFAVRATDAAGNTDASPATHAWTVDTAAPNTTITSAPTSPTNATSATFAFTASEGGSTFQCSLDGGAYTPCTSPITYTVTAGNRTFAVRAIDPAGNTDGSPATHAWTVDTTAPDTTITASPSNPTNSTTATFSFTSTEAGSTFQCSLDGGAYAPCTSPATYTVGAGNRTFAVRATDAAGNADGSPATHAWTVDTTAPDTTITAAPATPTNATSATFSFTSTEAGSSFECSLDGGAYAPCTSPVTYTVTAGNRTFAVRATDPAGNTDASPATHAWTVDTTPPNTTITAAPATPTNATSATFSFTSSEAGSTFQCSLDGAPYAPCASPVTYTVAAGNHTFGVRAIDAAGNVDGTPATHAWTVDTTAPDTAITSSPSNPSNDTTPTFAFTSTEAGSTFECSIDGGVTYAACTSPATFTVTAGSRAFRVRATDPAGNTDATPAAYDWTVDTTAPDTTITSSPSNPSNDTTPTFAFTSTEAGSTFECSIDGGVTYAACTTPATFTVTAGSRAFRVRATDPAGNTDGTPAAYNWTVDTTAPDTTITSSPSNPSNDTTPTFAFTSTEAGSTFECSIDGGVTYAACTSPATFTVSPGNRAFRVRATDPAGNTDATPAAYNWTVDTTAPDTTITSSPSNPSNDTTPTFAFTSTEPGSTFECSIDGGVTYAACTSPATFTVTAGSRAFRVRATDAADNTDATPAAYNWTVDTTAPDTTITSAPSNPSNDTTPTFSFTSTEAGSTFQCSIDGGVTYSACTSPATFTVTAGSRAFRVRAIDPASNTDATPAAYNWTVDTTGPTTTITSSPPNPSNDTTPTFSFTANEAGSTFECSIDGGVTYASCTSPATFTVSPGNRAFRVRATDAANNTGAAAAYNWVVDTTPPPITITTLVGTPWPVDYADFTLSSTATDVARYECRLDTESFAVCGTTVTRTVSYGVSHTFYARACDTAGNCGTASQVTWTPNPGLVVHLPLDLDPGNTTRLGSAHDGVGPFEPVAAQLGFGNRVDNSGFAILDTGRPMSTSPDDGYTIAFWAEPLSGTYEPLIDFLGETGCVLNGNGDRLELCCRSLAESQCVQHQPGLPYQRATHVALVQDRQYQAVLLYLDGELVNGVAYQAGEPFFGPGQAEAKLVSSGAVVYDDVRFYNRRLSDSELCTLAFGNPSDGCFDQGVASELHADSSPLVDTGKWLLSAMDDNQAAFGAGMIDGAAIVAPGRYVGVSGLPGRMRNQYFLTLSGWFLDTSGATQNAQLFDMSCTGTACQGNGGLRIRENGANIQVCAYWGASGGCVNVAAATGVWHHVALRMTQTYVFSVGYVTSDIQVFIDGKLGATIDVPDNTAVLNFVPSSAVMVSNHNTASNTFDELEVFNTPIDDSQICGLAMGAWNGLVCN